MTSQQKEALRLLIVLRLGARKSFRTKGLADHYVSRFTKSRDIARKRGDRALETQMQTCLDGALESQLAIRFERLQLGIMFVQQAPNIARDLPREVWLEALSVNRRHWDSDDMGEYGHDPCKVVGILNLENSETEAKPENRPLNGCFELAYYNRLNTDPVLGKLVHEAVDEAFSGAISARFGDWQEPSILQRCGVHHG